MSDLASGSHHIVGDLACATCGYNLRTLLLTGRCPECGGPVLQSLEFHNSCRGLKPGRIFWGSLILGLLPAIGIARYLTFSWFPRTAGRSHLAIASGQAVFWNGWLFIGIFLLATSRPVLARCKLALVFCLAYPVVNVCVTAVGVIADIVPSIRVVAFYRTMMVFYAIGVMWEFGVCLIGFLFMRAVGRRLAQAWFSVLTMVAFSIVLIAVSYDVLNRAFYFVGNTQGYPWSEWWRGMWTITTDWLAVHDIDAIRFFARNGCESLYFITATVWLWRWRRQLRQPSGLFFGGVLS